MTRVSSGPFTLDIPPNGVAVLYEADKAGNEHLLLGGIGYLEALVQFAGEVIRLNAMMDRMRVDRTDQDFAIRDAVSETARCADELAFWRYQAIFHRAIFLDRKVLKKALLEDCAVWKEAERQLEAHRVDENKERYAHAEAPRDPGGT